MATITSPSLPGAMVPVTRPIFPIITWSANAALSTTLDHHPSGRAQAPAEQSQCATLPSLRRAGSRLLCVLPLRFPPSRLPRPVEQHLGDLAPDGRERRRPPPLGAGQRRWQPVLGEPSDRLGLQRMGPQLAAQGPAVEDERV